MRHSLVAPGRQYSFVPDVRTTAPAAELTIGDDCFFELERKFNAKTHVHKLQRQCETRQYPLTCMEPRFSNQAICRRPAQQVLDLIPIATHVQDLLD